MWFETVSTSVVKGSFHYFKRIQFVRYQMCNFTFKGHFTTNKAKTNLYLLPHAEYCLAVQNAYMTIANLHHWPGCKIVENLVNLGRYEESMFYGHHSGSTFLYFLCRNWVHLINGLGYSHDILSVHN